MSNLVTETNEIHGDQVRDLMMALAREVLWPFRWRVATILLMQIATQVMLLASLVLPWQLLQMLITGRSRIDGWIPGADANSEKIAVLIALAVLPRPGS